MGACTIAGSTNWHSARYKRIQAIATNEREPSIPFKPHTMGHIVCSTTTNKDNEQTLNGSTNRGEARFEVPRKTSRSRHHLQERTKLQESADASGDNCFLFGAAISSWTSSLQSLTTLSTFDCELVAITICMKGALPNSRPPTRAQVLRIRNNWDRKRFGRSPLRRFYERIHIADQASTSTQMVLHRDDRV